jgi:2-phosphosulfolactate phosphatase
MNFDQAGYQVRCEWGQPGMEILAPISDVVILVDVLSFSTAVDIALARGALIFPYPAHDDSAAAYAAFVRAELASTRRAAGQFTLSPASLRNIPAGHRLVLPSPNGAALAFASSSSKVFTACLRNSAAVAEAAARSGRTFAVIPAAERWPNGTLRPCLEDWIGAGAVLVHLKGNKSPEAELAIEAFRWCEKNLHRVLTECASGRELLERGFADDVALAAELDVSRIVPILQPPAGPFHPLL